MIRWLTELLGRPSVSWWDLLDIAVVAVLIYELLLLIRGTRAMQMALSGGFLIGLFFLSEWFHLETVNWVIRNLAAYVAELVGVNLYRGRADGEKIAINGTTIVAAEEHHGDVIVTIPPNAIVVYEQQPAGSARNVWPGTIALVERSAQRVRLRIESAVNVVAEITPAALAALDLREGSAVWFRRCVIAPASRRMSARRSRHASATACSSSLKLGNPCLGSGGKYVPP